MALQLGDTAPDFEAETTEGRIKFHDWVGGFVGGVVLASQGLHAGLHDGARLHGEDQARVRPPQREGHRALGRPDRRSRRLGTRHRGDAGAGAELPDRRRRRLRGLEALRDAARPTRSGDAKARTPADNQTVRNVFVVGPDKKIKLILVYPMTTGRNFDEVLRVIDSLQLTAKHKVSTPVNWQQGEDVIIAGSVSNDEAKELFPEGWKEPKPYIRIVPQPAE